MNNLYTKSTLCLFGFLLLFLTSNKAIAQCNNLTLSLTKTNSTCLANGKIQITVAGSDYSNIEQTTMQFEVSGDKDIAFTHYTNNTIENLPPGTYTIKLRAFCKVTNDWIISTTTATTTITSSYKEMNFSFGRIIPTLNCKPTGIIPVSIEAGTGSAPFTIEITSKPVAYTGTTIFSSAGRNYNISGLPAGSYTIKVSDACGYTIENRTATVGAMSQDYYSLFHQYFYPAGTTANACDLVAAYRYSPSSGTAPDDYYYFWSNSADYFEVAFVFNDTGTKTWQTLTSSTYYMNITLPSPQTMGSMRGSSNFMAVYLRVKGCTTEHKLSNITLDPTPLSVVNQRASGCDQINLELYPWWDYDGTICYPYEWRVIKTSDNSVVTDWQGPVSDRTPEYAYNVPTGLLKVEFKDAEGYTWSSSINVTTPPKPYLTASNPLIFTYLEPDGLYRSRVYPYFYPNTFPAGTTFQFLSGPTLPTHLTGTLATASSYIYPYSSSITSSSYVRMEPGIYEFEVTRPGCVPDIISTTHSVYKLASKPTYTLKEECDGLLVTFTGGGQIQTISSTGTTSDYGTPYVRIGSTIPSSIAYDNTKVVTHGGSLKLPVAGTYILYLGTDNSITNSAVYHDTIVYSPTPFTLDNAVTSAYLCQGEPTGFIRVKGAGGSGGYKYELYDNNVLKYTNKTGVFSYGMAGKTYTIKLYDTICGYSYPQDVTLIDLGIAQIAYSSSPDNKYCNSDSIYLKCLTLGETTYTWTGPGITATNKNKQNPAVFAGDVGAGTHTYTIKVTPETCGTEMEQSVTVIVQDCSGAHDDYSTLFVNTTDSIDILANDAFPSSCAGSITPVITVGPTKGSYTLTNNKVYYTPNTDFIGQDSLTYSTNCSGTVTTAMVYLTVIDYPDNIVDADCYITRDSTEWAIKKGWSSEPIVSDLNIPLVGDLDNDSIPDILCFGTVGSTGVGSYGFALKRMLIYDGQSHILKKTIDLPSYVSGFDAAGYGLVKLPDKTGLIVVACWDTYLRAYDITKPNGSELVWTSDTPFGTVGNDFAVNIGFADFNNDGYPEIYVRNKIYDAETGKLLAIATGGTNTGSSWAHYSHATLRMLSSPFAADIIGDSRLELLLGNEIYDVNIVSRTNPSLNSVNRIKTITPPSGTPVDGHVQVADFNDDGYLDILITNRNTLGTSGIVSVYIWDVHNNKINANPLQITTNFSGKSIPLIGDINNDGALDILIQCGVDISNYTYGNKAFRAYTYNTSTETFDLLWYLSPHEDSYSNSATLFDFNLNGKKELLISDQMNISIYDCNGTPPVLLNSFPFSSTTIMQYPVIVDVDNDGSAEIVAVAGGSLHILESDGTPWAPARKVWNQYNYNAVNVNENLTIPKYPLNPATFFPGDDGVLGTTKDVRPYNAFLQQQTMLDKNGIPLWLTPDIYPDQTLTSHSITGDSVSITIGMINKGDAAIGKPVYVSLYKESIVPANKMVTDSANIQILPGDTGYVTARIPNIMLYFPMVSIIARINDDGKNFPYQLECDDTNNIITIINPVLNRMMKKDATLDGIPHNGTYDNPVSALFSETIEYTITAVNANTGTGRVIIRDTLPPYLNFVSSNPVIVPTTAGTVPQRDALEWNIAGVASMATTTVTVKATPHPGCSSSQPMFINRAWVTVSDTITVPTNSTYHQGACVGVATFSAGFGGNIYNAAEQALDYRTTPRAGIVIVPDEGYRFAGWSHGEYISLRGHAIKAEEGIMHYDTLTVYGNVELQANFELEEYPIEYHLNGSDNAGNNPPAYTIESGSITLEAPEKAGDVFTGWTGSNGEKPQMEVTIPNGSTGELEFYANFLRSGREEETRSHNPEEDRIWAVKDELHIRTSKAGSIVRVYSTEGLLQKQQTIRQAGKTKMKLQRGIYVVTLNNDIGKKIIIE